MAQGTPATFDDTAFAPAPVAATGQAQPEPAATAPEARAPHLFQRAEPAIAAPSDPVVEAAPSEMRGGHWNDTLDAFFGTRRHTPDDAAEDAFFESLESPQAAPAPAAAFPDRFEHTDPRLSLAPVDDNPIGLPCAMCGTVNSLGVPVCSGCGADLPLPADTGDEAVVGDLVGPQGMVLHVVGVTSIGRDPRNSLVVRDAAISRVHCRVEARNGHILACDLRSTNGTWVNGQRVDQTELQDGDRLLVGRTELTFRVRSTATAPGNESGRFGDESTLF